MPKGQKQNNYCSCHISSDENILKRNVDSSFCYKCSCILIKDSNGNIYHTLKPKQKIKETDINSKDIIISMRQCTELGYPFLNEEYNMTPEENNNKEKIYKSLDLYFNYRKMIIVNLQKMVKMFDFSDLIFYQSLFYLDHFLSHKMTDEITEKEILYYLVGYFLCSAKARETDIYEPSFDSFCSIDKKRYLNVEKIAYYEILCLKNIKYNIFSYSAYDWLSELISIGYVFDCEVNKNNTMIIINGHRHSLVNVINKYVMKILLKITTQKIFMKFSPMYIAFSLILLAREKYLDEKLIRPELFNELLNLYGVNFKDFKKCYKEIKAQLEEKHKEEEDEKNDFDSKQLISEDTHGTSEKNENLEKKEKKSKKSKKAPPPIMVDGEEENEEDKEKEKDTTQNGDKTNTDNDNYNDNIIIFEENNEENNHYDPNELKLDLNINEDAFKHGTSEERNRLRSSLEVAHIKIKNSNKIYINCNTSENNLSKINSYLEQNKNHTKHHSAKKTPHNGRDSINNLKLGSSFQDIDNNYNKPLDTHRKILKPIKIFKVSNSTDNKRYSIQNTEDTNNSNYNLKKREGGNSMKKSLFGENLNSARNHNNNLVPHITGLKNLIKEDSNNSFEENKNETNYNSINNNEEYSQRNRYKSKSKYKNHLIGKEVKVIKNYKRNQSSNKDHMLKNSMNTNNIISSINNIPRKMF